MKYTTAFDIGKRKREKGGINEDSVAVNLLEEGHRDADRRAGVFVLADGAGGAQAGDVASYVVTVEVTRRLTEKLWNMRRLGEMVDTGSAEGSTMGSRGLSEAAVTDPLADISDDGMAIIIEEAIQETHTRLIEVINEYDLDNAYSTVVVGVKIGDRFHYGWVGDSRAYVVNTAEERDDDQRVSLLTKDHSVVERLVNEGEIDEVEAYVHRRGNRVTRALGGTRGEDPATSSVEVDTSSIRLFGDDVILLTSDGLIDAYTGAPELHKQYEQADDTEEIEEAILEKSVTDDEIRDVILAADSLEAAAQRFVDLSNERGGKDNVSMILFRDHYLPRSPVGGLPVRIYDPDPEAIVDWETVLMRSEDDGEAAAAAAGAGGAGASAAAASAAGGGSTPEPGTSGSAGGETPGSTSTEGTDADAEADDGSADDGSAAGDASPGDEGSAAGGDTSSGGDSTSGDEGSDDGTTDGAEASGGSESAGETGSESAGGTDAGAEDAGADGDDPSDDGTANTAPKHDASAFEFDSVTDPSGDSDGDGDGEEEGN